MYNKKEKEKYNYKISIIILFFISILNSDNLTFVNKRAVSPDSIVIGNTGINIGDSNNLENPTIKNRLKIPLSGSKIKKLSVFAEEINLTVQTRDSFDMIFSDNFTEIDFRNGDLCLKDKDFCGDLDISVGEINKIDIKSDDSKLFFKKYERDLEISINGDSYLNISKIKNLKIFIRGDSSIDIGSVETLRLNYQGDIRLKFAELPKKVYLVGEGDIEMEAKSDNFMLKKSIKGDFVFKKN